MTSRETQRLHVAPLTAVCDDPRCVSDRETLREELARVREELELTQKEVGKARTAERRAKGERNRRWQQSPFADDAWKVWDKWKEAVLPAAKEFDVKRAEAVIARLEGGRTLEELFLAIEGARAVMAGELWKPRNPKGYCELAKVCESDAMVIRFIDHAEEAKLKRDEAGRAARHIFLLRSDGTWDNEIGALGTCPACDQTPMCQLQPSGEFRCANGCTPDDILKGLRAWWCETYPDQRSRRLALEDIATGKRLDAQREDAA